MVEIARVNGSPVDLTYRQVPSEEIGRFRLPYVGLLEGDVNATLQAADPNSLYAQEVQSRRPDLTLEDALTRQAFTMTWLNPRNDLHAMERSAADPGRADYFVALPKDSEISDDSVAAVLKFGKEHYGDRPDMGRLWRELWRVYHKATSWQAAHGVSSAVERIKPGTYQIFGWAVADAPRAEGRPNGVAGIEVIDPDSLFGDLVDEAVDRYRTLGKKVGGVSVFADTEDLRLHGLFESYAERHKQNAQIGSRIVAISLSGLEEEAPRQYHRLFTRI